MVVVVVFCLSKSFKTSGVGLRAYKCKQIVCPVCHEKRVIFHNIKCNTAKRANIKMSQPNLHSELPFLPFVKALEAIYTVKQSAVKKTEEKKHYLKCYIEAFNDAKEKFIQQHGKESVSYFITL